MRSVVLGLAMFLAACGGERSPPSGGNDDGGAMPMADASPPPATDTGAPACRSDCCAPLADGTLVCSAVAYCAPAPAPGRCTRLVLVANDGTFLGDATSNPYAVEGVCNEYSSYGSPYSTTSIYNEYGTYGSPYNTLSAYNEFTRTPPRLGCSDTGELLNPVTKNTFLADAIDPDLLCPFLDSNGY